MQNYHYTINKDAAFAYWAQSLIEWGWYFSPAWSDASIKQQGPLTDEEKTGLELLKVLLQKEYHGFVWLWKRYSSAPIENAEEREQWATITKTLTTRFYALWEEITPRLEQWKDWLEDETNTDKTSHFIEQFETFFETTRPSDVTVLLAPIAAENPNYIGGHTKREHNNLILLDVGGANPESAGNNALLTLLHETTHLLLNASSKEDLLKKAYTKTIAPLNIKQSEPSWRLLLTESLLSALASSQLGYANAHMSEALNRHDVHIERFEQRTAETNNRKIHSVAAAILPIVTDYLDNSRAMDETIAQTVADSWHTLNT